MLISPGSASLLTIQNNNSTDSIGTTLDVPLISSTPPLLNSTDLSLIDTPEYLSQLMKDRRQLAALPNVFTHVERLLDQEINKVRTNLFNLNPRPKLDLPEPTGEKKVHQEKILIPVQQYPDFNFVGRILGPRGMTAKELETDTGCKIMVRGRGSMRDKQKEEQNRGKPNWEHLDEDLHVLIQCEDYENRALVKLERAKKELNKLLKPATEGEDDLKKKQLTELAIINGTYREPGLLQKKLNLQNNPIAIGAPLILTPPLQHNYLTEQIQANPTSTLLTANQIQPTLTTIPQTAIMSNGELNYLQFLTPFQTIDQMNLNNGMHLFEYQNTQTTFPLVTSAGLTSTMVSNNAPGNMTSSSTSSSVSARYHPYTIQSARLKRS